MLRRGRRVLPSCSCRPSVPTSATRAASRRSLLVGRQCGRRCRRQHEGAAPAATQATAATHAAAVRRARPGRMRAAPTATPGGVPMAMAQPARLQVGRASGVALVRARRPGPGVRGLPYMPAGRRRVRLSTCSSGAPTSSNASVPSWPRRGTAGRARSWCAASRGSARPRCSSSPWPAPPASASCRGAPVPPPGGGGRADALEGIARDAIAAIEGRSPFEEARTRLVYGEWLRRAGRRVDARRELERAGPVRGTRRQACRSRAGRARRRAPRGSDRRGRARRADGAGAARCPRGRRGKSNRQVGAELFISPRTVEVHLSRVYRKLGITSRLQLARLDAVDPGALVDR